LLLGRHLGGVDVGNTHFAFWRYGGIECRRVSTLDLHGAGFIGFFEIHSSFGHIELDLVAFASSALHALHGEHPHGSSDAGRANGRLDIHVGSGVEFFGLTDHRSFGEDEFSFRGRRLGTEFVPSFLAGIHRL
jgi:hypothetical protein